MLRTRGGAADGWQTSPEQARAARDRAASSYGSPLRFTPLMHAKSLLVHILDAPDTRKIFLFFCINFVFMLVEVTYGMWSNSLGLISDAAHMLFDCSALLLGMAASYIARWRPDEGFSFGYGRAEVLAGFTNALFLLFIAIYILFEALERLVSPPHLDPDALFTVSVIGLLVNCVGMAFFWEQHAAVCSDENCLSDHGGSENLRALFLHVLADTLGSIGVVISSLVISNYRLYWVDPFCSILIAAMMIHLVLPLLCTSGAVLAQSAPLGAEAWLAKASCVPCVSKVISFHCWTIAGGHVVVTIRAIVEPGADVGAVREQLTALFRAVGIHTDRMAIELSQPTHSADLDYVA